MAKRIVAVLADLIFRVKIGDAAKRAAVEVEFVGSPGEEVLARSAGAAVVILDLDFVAPEVIGRLRDAGVETVGYVSHVKTEVIRRAKAEGCGVVMARSAFVEKLGEMMREWSGEGQG